MIKSYFLKKLDEKQRLLRQFFGIWAVSGEIKKVTNSFARWRKMIMIKIYFTSKVGKVLHELQIFIQPLLFLWNTNIKQYQDTKNQKCFLCANWWHNPKNLRWKIILVIFFINKSWWFLNQAVSTEKSFETFN